VGDIGGRGSSRGEGEGHARKAERLRKGERALDAMRESEQSPAALRALFDGALDAILVATDDRRYVDANPAA